MTNGKLHTLIALEEFKALMGIDDREDRLARFCLVTSTCAIEQYCKRKFLRKRHFETMNNYQLTINNENVLFMLLREYPVISINSEQLTMNNGEKIGKEFYRVIPDCGSNENYPYSIELSPAVARMGCKAIKLIYLAGYAHNSVPADLAAACLELASWNMNRYRGRRVGLSGNVRGGGKEGEHFEMSMPENVKALLEPYKRRVI
jgi:hypothetical protein